MDAPNEAVAEESVWTRLAKPFARERVLWSVLELADDGQRARVRPQLQLEAVTARLDEVLRAEGWSNLYAPLQDAVVCTLTVQGVSKSAVSDAPRLGPAERAHDALVRAAEGFGLRPPVDQEAAYWVDYDTEAGEMLYEPETAATPPPTGAFPPASPLKAGAPESAQPPESAQQDRAQERDAQEGSAREGSDQGKSEGQKAIDRLVERLKEEGKGAQVARLIVEFAGYGGDPEQSRELYRRLRALLKDPSGQTR